MKTTKLLAPFFGGILFLAAACQMPLSSPAKTSGSGFQLNFLIAGAGSTGTATQAKLLLPTVSTLTVKLTSLNDSKVPDLTQTTAISAGANSVSVNFGAYGVKAQALDSSGTVQFLQTGIITLTSSTASITLNLVPAFASTANDLSSGQSISGTLAAGAALSWRVPLSALTSLGAWSLSLTTDSSVKLFAQDYDGKQFPASATVGSLTKVQPSLLGPSFITLYNSGTASQTYSFVLNASTTTTSVTLPRWAKTSSPVDAQFLAVAIDGNGNSYAVGYQNSSTTFTYGPGVTATGVAPTSNNIVVVKYGPTGNVMWAQSGGGSGGISIFNAVAVDSSGNVYAAGYQSGTGTYTYGSQSATGKGFGTNVLLVKYDTNGNALWAKTTDPTSVGTWSTTFTGVAVDASGNAYVTGNEGGNTAINFSSTISASGLSSTFTSALLVKYDTNGVAQWAKSGGYISGASSFLSVAVDSSGSNVYAAGYQNSNSTFTYGGQSATGATSAFDNVLLVKYNSAGTSLWARTTTSGGNNSRFNSVAVDGSGNVYAVGYQTSTYIYSYGGLASATGTSASQNNSVLVKYDSSGTGQWAQSIGGAATYGSQFNSVAVDGSGNPYVAGSQYGNWAYDYGSGVVATSGGSLTAVALVKYDSLGVAQWAFTLTAGSNNDQFNSVAVDSSGRVSAAGWQYGSAAFGFGNGVTATGPYSANNALLVQYSP